MPRIRRATGFAVAMLLAAPALAACGGDDGDSPVASTSTGPAQPVGSDTTGGGGDSTTTTRAPADVLPATTAETTTSLGVDSTVSSLGVATTRAN